MADVVAGKAVWEAGIDRSKIPADAAAVNADITATGAKGEQAATASATSTLAKVQGLSRAAASTVALGAGAMFGVATKLAADGENAMAKFQAQTGATQQEAETALASMNRLAGQNLQSFGTISDALTQVTTNMGLTGQAAEDTTNLILKFSTATGTDAVQNVTAFDDVLDSWGKTAADLPEIMDMIVASTQKYGGSTTEATAALKDMAPALRGMGASMSDGIALLDLFRASGVDASGATAGLARAVKTLKPGQTLDDLIAQIGAIEDPTLRAQKAIEIFGKSGAKLGNAIQPGMTSLDDFKVSVDDAAGATDKAASAIEDTLPNKVKLAVDGALAKARDFATGFGPALMGASSLASIGTSIATALKLDKALEGAWKAAASSDVALAAARAAGIAGGAAAGAAATAATIAAPIVLFAAVVIVASKVIPNPVGDSVTNTSNGRTLDTRPWWDHLADLFGGKPMPPAADGTPQYSAPILIQPDIQIAKPRTTDTHATTDAGFRDLGSSGAAAFGEGYETHFTSDVGARQLNSPITHGPRRGTFHDAGHDASIYWTQGFSSGWSDMAAAGSKIANQVGVHYGEQFIVGFKSTRDQAKSEWQQYLDDLAHPHRGEKTVGWIVGKLTGEDLAKGLASSDPVVRHSAEQEQQNLRVQLQGMLDDGYTIGKKTLAKLGLGIVDGKIVAITAARGASGDVNDALGNTGGYASGYAIAKSWADGFVAALHAGVGHVNDALLPYNHATIGQSPPPEGPLKNIDKGGFNIGRAWALGLTGGMRSVDIGGALGFGPLQQLTGGGAVIRHEGTVTHEVRLSGDTIAAARAQGASWDDIGRIGAAASQAHLRTIGPRQYA